MVVILHLAWPAWALDIDAPARVEVSVADSAGKPVAGASVRLRLITPEADRELAKVQTDGNGRAEIRVPPPAERPEGQLGWQCRLEVEREGLFPHTDGLQLFPGAILKQSVALATPKTTLIRVLDATGKSLPGVSFTPTKAEDFRLYLAGDRLRTEADGQCRWVHAPLEKIAITGDGWSRRVKDAQRVDVTLTKSELRWCTPRRLEGLLLTADGKPAAGWFVAAATCTGGCGSGRWTFFYSCSALTPVDADGRFTLEIGSRARFVAVSPEGIPFMFPLNQSAWPESPRRLSLTLPPVLRMHKGTLLLADGKPAAGFPIRATGGSTSDGSWELHMRQDSGSGGWDWGRPLAHPQFRPIVTDAQGRYELPIYAGAATSYRTWDGRWFDGWVGHDPVVKVTGDSPTPTKEQLREYTHTIIRVADASGKELLKARAWSESRDGSFRCDQFTDSRGIHFFTNSRTNLDIHVAGEGWADFVTSISTEAPTVTVTVPEENRFKPLKGKVLDSQGRPVEGVRVVPFAIDTSGNRQHLGIAATTTNAKGEFSLVAPDECRLDLHRWDDTGMIPTMPGWARPRVTARDRDITIRLSPTGSCRVLLPAPLESCNVCLTRPDEDAIEAASQPNTNSTETFSFYPVSDRQDMLTSPCLTPGEYKLSISTYEPSLTPYGGANRKLVEEPLRIESGQETLVDLRTRAEVAAAVPSPKCLSRVTVRRAGQAASGATVWLFWTEAMDDPRIAQWIAQLGDDKYLLRVEAGKRLSAAGKAAGPALREAATHPDAEIRSRASTLLAELAKDRTQPIRAICGDLADQDGTVNFEVEKGRKYIAVAHMPGVAIGWTTYVGGAEVATVDLRATRQVKLTPVAPAVASQSPPASHGREPSCYWSFADVSAEAAMAVMHVLGCRENRPGEGVFGLTGIISGEAFILYDAPTGVELLFQTDLSPSAGKTRVRIAADSLPVIEVKLGQPGK